MEREIKFKGKRVDNGEWVCGSLINKKTLYDNGGIEYQFKEWEEKYSYIYENNCYEEYPENLILVIPDTVCQCIGLNDKNAVEIYDKDIADINGLRYEIYFDQDRLMYVYRDKSESMYNISRRDNVKIVGNMVDNPELLGGMYES